MLKWRRHKCGGSQPEGLDKIDAATTQRTQSMRSNTLPSSRSTNRKNNELFTRSYSEISDRQLTDRFINSYSEGETLGNKRPNLKSLILEPPQTKISSPFVNVQLQDLYNGFERASLSAPSSPQYTSDDEVYLVTPPRPARQSSGGSVRRLSPTNLPCIAEAAENDELLSIADSGICDEDYDHKKHYFEPLKFHDDDNTQTTSGITHCHTKERLNDVNRDFVRRDSDDDLKQQQIENELTSSQESSSSLEHISFNCSKHDSIDDKNRQIFNRMKLKADLHSPTMPRVKRVNEVPHSVISSMLWNGSTSDHFPSSTGVYKTVPPNRYGQRNQDLMSQLTNNNNASTPTSPDRKSPKEFKVKLDVSHYGPDEILVTLEDGKLVVNGKHFSESEYGFESMQFHRRYPIPEGIKKADIKSTITDEGILIITGRVCTPTLKTMVEQDCLSEYDNSSPRLQRHLSSGRSTPEVLSSDEQKMISPSSSRRSLATSDYSEDSRSVSSNISDHEFCETSENTYALAVNCKGYDPQDLEIKIQNHELIVHYRQKICTVEDGHERVRHKEFTKRFSVPRNANCHQITSRFTDDEQLIIEIKKGGSLPRQTSVREDILDVDGDVKEGR